MEKCIVGQIQLKQRTLITDIQDEFIFRKDKKYHWLQKLCFYILRKIGAYNISTTYTYDRLCINTGKVARKFFDQFYNIQKNFNITPKDIYIGSEDFSLMLAQNSIPDTPFCFQINFHKDSRYEDKITIHGVNVHVIPWMKGMVLV